MKKIFYSIAVMALVLFAAACGEQANQQGVEVTSNPAGADQEPKVKVSDVISDWREDEARFEGGQFSFTMGDENISTEFGYADFRFFEGKGNGKLTLLSNPLRSKHFPILRIVAADNVASPEELIDKTITAEKISLKPAEDTTAVRGEGSVKIIAIAGGFIEGTFTGSLADGSELNGSFRARLNRAANVE